jgi:hypothetical protein
MNRRYYGAQIRKLWVVIEKLATAQKFRPSERVADAYESLIATLSEDNVPESIRERFVTLCREFREANDNPNYHYLQAAKMYMHHTKVRYFSKAIFELCRDGIQSETTHRDDE